MLQTWLSVKTCARRADGALDQFSSRPPVKVSEGGGLCIIPGGGLGNMPFSSRFSLKVWGPFGQPVG